MRVDLLEKLKILSESAKYDVSCSSSGSKRSNEQNGLGNSDGMGICHSYTEDGRCVSLLKILLTNYCIYDCAYCISRKSNDVKRVAFTVEDVVDLTINFYRRNYIEGLFLSSGIFKNADYTMERLVRIAKELRLKHNYNGYIHLKSIPGASDDLVKEAGLYADRLSVNIELPTEVSLKKLAPEKNYADVFKPMNYLNEAIEGYKKEKTSIKTSPSFVPAGQSTQVVIGASPESDYQILTLASDLYKNQRLKRVYYSGYIPVSTDTRLSVFSKTPLIRENRLYQADWLLRFYGFSVNEIIDVAHPDLDLKIDPKLNFALNNPHLFPIDINTADYEMILKVPGIGLKSARMIVSSRRFGRLNLDHLKKLGVALNRAKWFINQGSAEIRLNDPDPVLLRERILNQLGPKNSNNEFQLKLFA